MLAYLDAFSDSFRLAIVLWPFIAAFLTLPVLVVQYRRYNQVVWRRVVGVYLLMLYALALVSFTLYPFPDDPLAFCRDYQLSPQLNPFGFLADIRSDGIKALLQVVMNFIFFVPLGVFGRLFFHWRLRWVLLSGLLTSLFIETAQLTGGFGLYPCSYRLFDVDDILINTLGAAAGFLAAVAIPKQELEKADKGDYARKPGLLRHIVAFILDSMVATFVTFAVLIVLYFVIGNDAALRINSYVYGAVVVLVYGVLPYFTRGWSPGGYLTRLKHDDHERPVLRRVAFYTLRAVIAGLLLVAPDIFPFMTVIVILLVWLRWKKLPYQFV